jgi:hypothetical protein
LIMKIIQEFIQEFIGVLLSRTGRVVVEFYCRAGVLLSVIFNNI